MSRLSDSLHVVAMEEQQQESHREMSPNETRNTRGAATQAATARGACQSPHSSCLRPKAKDVAMFINVGSSNTKPCQQQQQQPQYEQRPNAPEWLMSQSTGVTSSMSHNTPVGLLLNRGGRVGGTSPTRRLSVTSGLQSRISARRICLNRQRIESRFGKARKNLSKTFNSMHLMGAGGGQMESNALKSKATQTMGGVESRGENIAVHGGTAETFRRLSRIPVPREKLQGPRNKTPVSMRRNMVAAGSSYSAQFALGNVYSLMTMCVSETKLEEIRSSSAMSVSVRPVVEAHESCTVMDVNILRLGEVRSKQLDVDRTLENWKPTTAEVSLVPEEKPKLRTKKSIVKKDKSRDKSVERSRDKSVDRSKDRSTKEEKPKKEEQLIPPPTKVAVIDLDKQAFQVPTIKSRSSSRARSSRRSEHNDDDETNEDKNGGEKRLDSPGSGSGSNFRVRFSPHLVSPAASSPSSSRGKFSSTKATSPAGSTTSVPKYPDLVRRVTDQAITSIAKSVILGMPSHQSRYETPHPTISFSNYRLPMPSPSYASNNYRSSFHNNYQRMPPMTMSSMNVHDDSTSHHMGFRFPSRNASQLSISSMLNYRPPSTTGSVMGGMHQSGRYPYYSSHPRIMSNHSMAKSRKEFDNRYSLHHHTHNSSIWDAPPQSLPPPLSPPPPRNSWVHDSSSVYNMHSGEYGTRMQLGGSSAPASTSTSQNFWLRYQKMKTNRGNDHHSPASSTSSLYTPSAIPKYDKPSQRFSLIRNHGGGGGGAGGGMRSSMENLHGHTMMNRKAMEQHSVLLHRPMSMAMETGAGGLLHRPMSMEAGGLHHRGPMSMESTSHLQRPMPMESYLTNRAESSYM